MIQIVTPSKIDAAPPRYQTAEQYVYEHMRRQILSGAIPGGTHLNQDEIAARLDVSRTPVRQAFLHLGSDGLVTNRPNRGSVVTSLSPDEILELFEIRAVLEGFAVSLALPRLDARAQKSIKARVDALDAAQADASRWIELHDELHHFLCELSGRPRLVEQVRQLRQRVVPYLRLYLSADKDAEIIGYEHRVLADLLGRKTNAAAVEKTVREHVMSSAQGVVDFVRSQG
jgi:DNA-binding GntR family transcriptional regulator